MRAELLTPALALWEMQEEPWRCLEGRFLWEQEVTVFTPLGYTNQQIARSLTSYKTP
jgi:hypothetical protein